MDNRPRYYQILPDKFPERRVRYILPPTQARLQEIPMANKALWVQRAGNAQPTAEARVLGKINEIRMGRASQNGDPQGR